MRDQAEINHALSLFELWVGEGFLGAMETEEDVHLVISNYETLQWVMGKDSQSFTRNLDMFQKILTENGLLRLN